MSKIKLIATLVVVLSFMLVWWLLPNQDNKLINFHGRIIDQNNQPLIGVKVECQTSYWGRILLPGLLPQNKKIQRISDGDGRFSVRNETGMNMAVKLAPQKGYEFKDDGILGISFRDVAFNTPAPKVSTPEKPYIFRAFKYGLAEPLFHGAIAFYDCVPDGRFYLADFKSKRISEGADVGDLKISIRRPFRDAYDLGHHEFDWSVQIQGVGSDILESDDVFMYHAPTDGYQPSWSFSRQAGQSDYRKQVKPKFYFKSRDGSSYGRLEFEILPHYRDGAAIILYYWINPEGSRNLEPPSR